MRELSKSGRFTDIRTTIEMGNPEIQIIFDQERAAALGLAVRDIADRVVANVRGELATRYTWRDKKIDVLVRSVDTRAASIEEVRNLIVNPGSDFPVPLSAVADVKLAIGPAEIRRILQHGPWPSPIARDPSNRVSGSPLAVALGQRLFFEPRMSGNGAIACATCHVPARAWTDGRPRALGLDRLDRNTPTLLDAALNRWFFWDGRADSLWAQSVQPIVDPREMGASARHVVPDRPEPLGVVVLADGGSGALLRRG